MKNARDDRYLTRHLRPHPFIAGTEEEKMASAGFFKIAEFRLDGDEVRLHLNDLKSLSGKEVNVITGSVVGPEGPVPPSVRIYTRLEMDLTARKFFTGYDLFERPDRNYWPLPIEKDLEIRRGVEARGREDPWVFHGQGNETYRGSPMMPLSVESNENHLLTGNEPIDVTKKDQYEPRRSKR